MNTTKSRRLMTLLTALLALSMFAAACGGSDEAESATGTATSECGTDNSVTKGDKVTDLSVAVVAQATHRTLRSHKA